MPANSVLRAAMPIAVAALSGTGVPDYGLQLYFRITHLPLNLPKRNES